MILAKLVMVLCSHNILNQDEVEWIWDRRYEEFKEMEELMRNDKI